MRWLRRVAVVTHCSATAAGTQDMPEICAKNAFEVSPLYTVACTVNVGHRPVGQLAG